VYASVLADDGAGGSKLLSTSSASDSSASVTGAFDLLASSATNRSYVYLVERASKSDTCVVLVHATASWCRRATPAWRRRHAAAAAKHVRRCCGACGGVLLRLDAVPRNTERRRDQQQQNQQQLIAKRRRRQQRRNEAARRRGVAHARPAVIELVRATAATRWRCSAPRGFCVVALRRLAHGGVARRQVGLLSVAVCRRLLVERRSPAPRSSRRSRRRRSPLRRACAIAAESGRSRRVPAPAHSCAPPARRLTPCLAAFSRIFASNCWYTSSDTGSFLTSARASRRTPRKHFGNLNSLRLHLRRHSTVIAAVVEDWRCAAVVAAAAAAVVVVQTVEHHCRRNQLVAVARAFDAPPPSYRQSIDLRPPSASRARAFCKSLALLASLARQRQRLRLRRSSIASGTGGAPVNVVVGRERRACLSEA
jgi:hypothetical protein